MLIGNGLIASAFRNYENNDNVIIFASGVSNSSGNNKDDFEREFILLSKYIKIKNKRLVYFSTCSISDGSKKSDYINHKINMENFIKNNHNDYIIFRLPIVIGKSYNKNTFFNSFKNKITNSENIIIYENITRYLIDIEDISKILPSFIEDVENNYTMDICFNNNKSVLEIVQYIEESINIKSFIILKNEKNINHLIDNSLFISKLKKINYHIDEDYTQKIIKKYL